LFAKTRIAEASKHIDKQLRKKRVQQSTKIKILIMGEKSQIQLNKCETGTQRPTPRKCENPEPDSGGKSTGIPNLKKSKFHSFLLALLRKRMMQLFRECWFWEKHNRQTKEIENSTIFRTFHLKYLWRPTYLDRFNDTERIKCDIRNSRQYLEAFHLISVQIIDQDNIVNEKEEVFFLSNWPVWLIREELSFAGPHSAICNKHE